MQPLRTKRAHRRAAGFTLLLFTIVCVIVPARPARAHPTLVASDPAPGATLPAPPAQISLTFSDPVVRDGSAIRLLDAGADLMVEGVSGFRNGDARLPFLDLPVLPPGEYIVQWVALSAVDGHAIQGTFRFSVAAGPGQVGTGPPVAGTAGGTNGGDAAPGPAAVTAKALGLLSALLLFGFHLVWLVTGAVGSRASRAVAATSAVLQVAYWWLVRAAHGGGTFASLGGGPHLLTVSEVLAVTFAVYAGLLIVPPLAIGGLPKRTLPRTLHDVVSSPWAGLAAGTVALGGFALTGHAGGSDAFPLSAVLVDVVHLSAAGTWVGALAHLVLGWVAAHREGRRLARPFVRKLTALAVGGVAVVTLTGLFNAELRGVRLATLTATAYGRTLAWKLAFVGAMLVLGALHSFVARPWKARGARLWRAAVALEVAALLLVVGTTAMLTLSVPPATRSATRTAGDAGLSLSTHAGPVLVITTLTPNRPGTNTVRVKLDRGSDPVDVETVSLRVAPIGAEAVLRPVAGQPGAFSGVVIVPHPGVYTIELVLDGPETQQMTASIERWPLPAPGARELLKLTDEVMSLLSSVRVDERLSDGVHTVERTWWYQAPDRIRAEVAGGGEQMVIVGRDRWTSRDGESWTHSTLPEPVQVPNFSYTEQATEVELLGRRRIGEREAFAVAFRYGQSDTRFVMWIDTVSHRLVELEMMGSRHFMHWTFRDFNESVSIEPPG